MKKVFRKARRKSRKLVQGILGKKRNDRKSPLSHPPKLRKGVRNIKVQEDVFLQVYWKSLQLGSGPALILYLFEQESLKFDCFGEGKGHYHLNNECYPETKEDRIHIPESSREKQIDRAVFEMKTNLSYYLQRNRDKRVRCLKIDQAQLELALKEAGRLMVAYATKAPTESMASEA